MAKTIITKPKSEIIGPTVIRLKENISGLYSVAPLGSPTIRQKPIIIITNEIAISIKLSFGKLYFISYKFKIKKKSVKNRTGRKSEKYRIVLHKIQVVCLHSNILIHGKDGCKEGEEQTRQNHDSGHYRHILPSERQQP